MILCYWGRNGKTFELLMEEKETAVSAIRRMLLKEFRNGYGSISFSAEIVQDEKVLVFGLSIIRGTGTSTYTVKSANGLVLGTIDMSEYRQLPSKTTKPIKVRFMDGIVIEVILNGKVVEYESIFEVTTCEET
jgi:hypothetical protein